MLAAPMYRFRGLFMHVALAAAVLAAGCSQQSNTSLIDQVRNADLSEKRPQPVKQANSDPNQQPKRQSETYPGDDSFGEQLTSASATAASAPGTPRSPHRRRSIARACSRAATAISSISRMRAWPRW